MPYEFEDYIKPQGSSSFAILEDVFLQGSFRVLEKDSDKDNINPITCKEGMIIFCLDTNKLYSLNKFISDYDEFGDPLITIEWTEFTISATPNNSSSTSTVALGRWKLSFKTTLLNPGESQTIKLPFAKAIILEKLEVNSLCDIEFKETSNEIILGDYSTFNHTITHSFTDTNKLIYSNEFIFPDGTPLNTRYTQLFINKDPVLDKLFYYNVTNTNSSPKEITTKFLIVGIHN